MSKYTTELRYVVEMSVINSGNNLKGVTYNCTIAAPIIFNFNYPIWAESERVWFETAFLRHFYTQEICAETVGLWKIFLEDWLISNMPYWNNMILAFNKLSDIESILKQINTETEHYSGDREENNSGDSKNSSTGNSFQKYYEVPSSMITQITDHLNNATQLDTSSEGNANYADNKNMNEGHWKTVTFDNGLNINDTLQKYMVGLMNIFEKMWLAMEELFMGVY